MCLQATEAAVHVADCVAAAAGTTVPSTARMRADLFSELAVMYQALVRYFRINTAYTALTLVCAATDRQQGHTPHSVGVHAAA